MCLKSYFKGIVLKLATNGQSDKGFLLTSTFVPKGLSAPALGLYTCIKALKYKPGPGVLKIYTWSRCQVSVYRTTGPLVPVISTTLASLYRDDIVITAVELNACATCHSVDKLKRF